VIRMGIKLRIVTSHSWEWYELTPNTTGGYTLRKMTSRMPGEHAIVPWRETTENQKWDGTHVVLTPDGKLELRSNTELVTTVEDIRAILSLT